MIQGSIMNSFMHRKMEYSGDLELSGDKTHLLVPVAFTIGKGKIEKDEEFSFMTALKLQMFENLVTVEWNPELYRHSGGQFSGTQVVGPSATARPLRGHLRAVRDFDVKELDWLCKLWIHQR